jgi:hypothetical protein
MSSRPVAVALVCFGGKGSAAKALKPFEERLRSNGDTVLQTTILKVDAKHKASVHDPQRVLRGTLTAALTWGLFGVVAGTDKVESAIVWAVLGALCGGVYAYTTEHLLSKSELARIGRRLAPDSSAFLSYVETTDAGRLLTTAGAYAPSMASVAVVDSDMNARVFAGTAKPTEVLRGSQTASSGVGETAVLSMLLDRYADPKTAAQVAQKLSKSTKQGAGTPQVELVIETDGNGRRRVSDPSHGTSAWARSDTISWGLFGLVWGAIVGALGGGGILGFLEGGLETGIGWAIFGVVAGALYGLWAGRSISARRLEGIGSILAAGTSAVLAWSEGVPRGDALGELAQPGAQALVLRFDPVERGAVLEA